MWMEGFMMDLKNRKADFSVKMCAAVLAIFIFYTQYFQHVIVAIPYMVTITGAALIAICGYFFIWHQIDFNEFSIKELNIFFLFYVVTLYTGAIGSASSAGIGYHIQNWLSYFLYFLVTPCVMYIVMTKKDIIMFVKLYGCFALFCALTLIVNPITAKENMVEQNARYTIGRSLNVNLLGQYFTFGCWCILFLIIFKPKLRFPGFISIGMLLYGVNMTGSRKNLIAIIMIIGLWFLFIWFPENKNQGLKIIVIVPALVLLVFLAYNKFYLGSTIANRMDHIITNSRGMRNSRFDMYEDAFSLFKQHPFVGWGFKGYSYYFFGNASGYSHATYAEVPACTGLVGSCLFFGMYIYSIKKVIKLILLTNHDEDLMETNKILRMDLILWCSILFMGVGVIYIYELIGYLIFGVLFATIRYAEWSILEVNNKRNTMGKVMNKTL